MRVAPMTSRFLDACRRRPTDVRPVWFMRQAGRYMKSYRDVRAKNSLLEICKRPDLAAAVTLQPVEALDVDAAMEHLQAAKQHLANNEPGKADLELARAQQSVDTGSISTDMPLVRARENLALARDEVSSGKYSQAKTELKAAATALNNYAQDSHAQHAKDAKNLMTQIKSQTASMQGSHGIDKQKIDTWWNEVANWTGQKPS